MAFRGRGRGRGGGRRAKELPFDLFPEIEGLGAAKFSPEKKQLIKWSSDLHRHCKSSPYFYVDPKERKQGPAKLQKPDIERFSDKESVTTKDKSELLDFISLDPAHIPGELVEDVRNKKRSKIQWNPKADDEILEKWEKWEKLEKENGGEAENKENEEEEEEEEDNADEDGGEMSDEHDYEQNIGIDDDEDDYNAVEEDDEPIF